MKAASAEVVLVAVGMAFALAGCGAPSPSSSTDSALDFPATEAPPPPPWTSLRSAGQVAGPFSGVGNQYVFTAIPYGVGFVGVGEDLRIGGPVDGAIWWTPDAMVWNRVDVSEAGLANSEVDLVATDGRRIIAVGRARAGDMGPEGPGISWISEDSKRWRRLAVRPFEDTLVSGLVGSPTGFMAWGGSEGATVMFHSGDGLSWDRVPAGDVFADAAINAVLPFRGGFVAVGAQMPARSDTNIGGPDGRTAAAWWSPDGLTWRAGSTDAGPGLGSLYVGATGLLALGGSECGSCIAPANLWQSADGQHWHRLGTDMTTFPIYSSDGARIVRFDWQGSGQAAASFDGSTWQPLGAPGTADLDRLIVGRNGLLVLQSIARQRPQDEVDGAVWYLPAT